MSERKVARSGDMIVCMPHLLIGLHNPGVIGPEPEPRKVLVQGKPAAGAGDPCIMCDNSNAVWAGAAAVFVGYSEAPLSGRLHICKHYGGKDGTPSMEGIQRGAGTVLVGGNISVGNVAAATRACKDLAKGRPGYDPNDPDKQRATQSENNCGIESCRQIINARRAKFGEAPLSEDDLLDESLQKGYSNLQKAEEKANSDRYKREQKVLNLYEKKPSQSADVHKANVLDENGKRIEGKDDFIKEVERIKAAREQRAKHALDKTPGTDGLPNEDRQAYGWTKPADREKLLNDHGVSSEEQPATLEGMESAVRNGQGVITSHEAGRLWGNSLTATHVVLVTGMEYDDNGELKKVVYNDTAVGCHQSMDKDKFAGSLAPGVSMNVTTNPVW